MYSRREWYKLPFSKKRTWIRHYLSKLRWYSSFMIYKDADILPFE